MITRFAPLLAAALLALPVQALACSPPPNVWGITHAWPEGGLAPVDAALLLRGREISGGNGNAFAEYLQVSVVGPDGEAVEGAFDRSYASALVAMWKPAAPWAPEQTYTVSLSIVNDDADWFGVPEDYRREHQFEFTTTAAPFGAPPAPDLSRLTATAFWRDVTECLDDFVGACFCQEERVIGQVEMLGGDAALALSEPGDFGEGYTLRLRVGPTPGDWRQTLTRPTLGGADAFRLVLGQRDNWPGDEVCGQPEVFDPTGAVTVGEVECFPLGEAPPQEVTDGGVPDGGVDSDGGVDGPDGAEDDPNEDSETGSARSDGCAASGASTPGVFSLLALLGLFTTGRRRRS